MMQQPGIHSLGHFSSSLDHRTRIILQEGPKGGQATKAEFFFLGKPKERDRPHWVEGPGFIVSSKFLCTAVRLREVELFQGKFKAEDLTSIRSRCFL
jgi:hypothetical protein